MLSLAFLAVFSLFSSVLAIPLQSIIIPPFDPTKILCQLPWVPKCLCPASGTYSITRPTVIGIASGTTDVDGAYRFPVKYASAPRWKPSVLATGWTLPNGSTNVSSLPLACPQPYVNASTFSEDCLSLVLYVPTTLTPLSSAPTLLWIHGGSFIVGSATGPGLDGSKLAIATGSIVAVVQYRLGALGFMAPSGATNLAVGDIINALKFLQMVVPAFGGSASKITIAGQSSGASMIRTLLAAPSVSTLFRSAILQSDPMDFGFLSTGTQQTLQAYYNQQVNCSSSDTTCQINLSVNTIINAQMDLMKNAVNLDAAAGRNEPIRPVLDGSVVTSPLDSTSTFPTVNKPLLVTTVAQEAAFAIYSAFPDPVPEDYLSGICAFTFGPDRANAVVAAPIYTPVPALDGSVDARVQLQNIGTDYLWKCSAWTFTRSWVQNGGTVYVGQFTVGATYPGNEVVPYCLQPGVVCHQDDIQIVFGTVSNATSAQSALITEIQNRYKSFLTNGNPNAPGFATWIAATNSNVHALSLGGSGEVAVGACSPSFWGSAVQYDYQFYNQ